jgi:protein-L-isoaspartate(D-aspartate) O-methyltransferase
MVTNNKRLYYGVIIVLVVLLIFRYYRLNSPNQDEFDIARAEMIEYLRHDKNITDEKVLEVMGRVPRHLFICPWLIEPNIGEQNPVIDFPLPYKTLEKEAYGIHGLPIAEGQSISSPYVVALMSAALDLEGSEKVLEIGTGSAYQAAVLSELCEEVYSIEIREILAKSSENKLKLLGYRNVKVKWADGYFGWKENAPFDAIIITCAVNHVPPFLIQQLADGGKMVLPLGSTEYFQILTLVEKNGDELIVTYLSKASFVPMVGEATKNN